MKTKTLKKDKVNLITLGCSKNLVDSENIMTQMIGNDISIKHEVHEDDTNVVVINTCGFIDVAKEESIQTILQFADAKKDGRIEKLFVTGCLSQRYKDDLRKEIPEVDDWFGVLELPELLAKFNADYKHELIGERISTTPKHFAYLKIAEGCSRTCSFCAIPLMRGKHISRTIEDLVKEATHLANTGVRELILISQELTYYGLDIYKKRKLATLMNELSKIKGIQWIRLHYAYPHKFPMEILDEMASNDKVCNYLDIPFQHASNKVLKDMRRNITMEDMEEIIIAAVEKVPNINIRTTFLVGFPGETEEDFEILCDFVKRMRFDRVGVFQYSHEEGTSAYEMEDDVPTELKVERANTLMEIQREISLKNNEQHVGTTMKVLFDRKEGDFFIGRTEFDSPEVDNEVLVDGKEHYVRIGDFADVKITKASEYDLEGDVVVLSKFA